MKKHLFIICSLILIGLDQLFKYLIQSFLPQEYDSVVLIPGILNLTHIKNSGSAFSLFEGQQMFLIIFTSLLILIGLYLFFFNKLHGFFLCFSVCMVVSGGIGNLIDRIMLGKVIDYIDLNFFPFQNFAIFNFADCLVVVGVICVVVAVFLEEHHKNNTEIGQKE